MRRFMDYLSSVNTALTPVDIRENPEQYTHFVGGVASPGTGWLKYLAGGLAAGVGFTGVQAIMQPYVAYETSKASTRAKYETELRARPEYGGRSYIGQSSLQMGTGLMEGYGQQFIPNIEASTKRQAELFQQYSPYYQDVAVQTEWLKAQAKYESSLAYPMEYGQAVATSKTRDRRMPYTVRIKN